MKERKKKKKEKGRKKRKKQQEEQKFFIITCNLSASFRHNFKKAPCQIYSLWCPTVGTRVIPLTVLKKDSGRIST